MRRIARALLFRVIFAKITRAGFVYCVGRNTLILLRRSVWLRRVYRYQLQIVKVIVQGTTWFYRSRAMLGVCLMCIVVLYITPRYARADTGVRTSPREKLDVVVEHCA